MKAGRRSTQPEQEDKPDETQREKTGTKTQTEVMTTTGVDL